MTHPADSYALHAEQFRAIEAFVRALPGATDYQRSKYARLADPVRGRHLLRLLAYELRVAGVDVNGTTVLDAGCGTGFYAVLFAALGARVEGVDMFPENIATITALAQAFSLPIHAAHRDVADSGLPDASVQLVYCTEAISHFSDGDGFLRECARVTRPGGTVIIADGNNGANPSVRGHIHDFWETSECGPFTTAEFPPGANLPYLYRRWMILRSAFPDLDDEQVFQLGLHTAGIGGEALRRAAEAYRATGKLPNGAYRRGMSQIRPEDGQRNEEPYDPRALAATLRSLGFRARVRPHYGFGRGALLPVLNTVGEWLGAPALMVAPRYLVIARKPA